MSPARISRANCRQAKGPGSNSGRTLQAESGKQCEPGPFFSELCSLLVRDVGGLGTLEHPVHELPGTPE